MVRPPSAFSIRAADPHYHPAWKALGPTFDVLMNGEPVSRVIAYDCGEGWVRRIMTDAAGMVVVDFDKHEVLEERIEGSVTVRWREAI